MQRCRLRAAIAARVASRVVRAHAAHFQCAHERAVGEAHRAHSRSRRRRAPLPLSLAAGHILDVDVDVEAHAVALPAHLPLVSPRE